MTFIDAFITKYNLGGSIEAAKWHVYDGKTTVSFATENKNVVGKVVADLTMEPGTYAVLETSQLRALLAVLGDDVKVSVKRKRDIPFAFELSDGTTRINFVLADPSVVEEGAELNFTPTWALELVLDKAFFDRYTKALSALRDVKRFTVVSNGTTVEIVLGYSETSNINRVTIPITATKYEKCDPIHFSAQSLKEILGANKDVLTAGTGIMRVEAAGLISIEFEADWFHAQYFIAHSNEDT
jgi:hypothetical protein